MSVSIACADIALREVTNSIDEQDKATCANVQANGGSCTYPACGCAEPPKSK